MNASTHNTAKRGQHLWTTAVGVFWRAVSFVVAWWAFTEGDWREGGVAIAILVIAAIVSLHMLPLRAWDWSLTGLLRFIPYFMKQSILGGFDVARRALHPRMPLNTGIETYQTYLPGDLPRVFLVWTISLLPGTASVKLEGDTLTIHVLNDDEQFVPRMHDLENRIARIFGIRSKK